jgi:hydroxymethylglutaryl-CoA lyase
MSDRVLVVEVGPRDGLQNEQVVLTAQQRASLVERLVAAGVSRIEAVAFVRPDVVPQIAGAEELMALLPRPPGVRYAGLVLNMRGLERALRAGVDEINGVVVTDTLSQRNQGVTTEEAIQAWKAIARRAGEAGLAASETVSACFGCPYEGEVAVRRVYEVVAALLEEPPTELVIADTIGAAVPCQVEELLVALETLTAGVKLRCHFHNTRNLGYANVFAAMRVGVRAFDSSIGGTGGCPFAPGASGNIATEDLVWTLQQSSIETGLDLAALIRAGRWLGDQLDRPLYSSIGRAGPFPPLASPVCEGPLFSAGGASSGAATRWRSVPQMPGSTR